MTLYVALYRKISVFKYNLMAFTEIINYSFVFSIFAVLIFERTIIVGRRLPKTVNYVITKEYRQEVSEHAR